jgi:hypothetical protein
VGLINIMENKFDFTTNMGDQDTFVKDVKAHIDTKVIGHLQQMKQELASKFIEDGKNESEEPKE